MAKSRGVFEKKPGSGIWWIQYFADGKRKRERIGRKSDAIDMYKVRRAAIFKGEKLPELRKRKVTLSELIDDAIAFAKEHHKHPRDTENKGALVKADLGHLPADKVTPDQITNWINKRRIHGRPISNGTKNRYKAFFGLVFREGVHSRKAEVRPEKSVRRKREPDGRKRFLHRTTEYPALLALCTSTRKPEFRTMFVMSVLSGMRKSEQFTLDWPDLDFQRDEINLDDTKNGMPRTIPMLDDLKAELLVHWERCGKPKRGRIFDCVDDPQLEWFERRLAKAGIENYTWHNNRHTFCSWYMMSGGALLDLKEIAGHKTLSMTARYAHLSPEFLKKGMSGMNRMLAAAPAEVVEFPSATKTATA